EVECRKQALALKGLLLRSLCVNHPVTFFSGLCLSLGIKGKAPKGNAATLLVDQDFSLHFSSCVMSSAAAALKDRHDLREEEEEDDEEGPKWTPLCAAVSEHVCKRFLSSEGDCEVMSRAWHLLGDLCRFSRGQAYGPLLSLALPKAGAFLALDTLDAAGASAAVACCQCVRSIVSSLGHGILERLKDIVKPLLALALQPKAIESEVDLDGEVLLTLSALCRSVGGFLSPFLKKFLEVACSPATLERSKALQDLGKDLVEGVPHRLLLKEVQAATVDPFKGDGELEEGLLRSQRLVCFYLWILKKATPEFVAAQDMMPALLRLFGISGSAVNSFLRQPAPDGSAIDAQEIPVRLLKRDLMPSLITSSSIEDLSWANVAHAASLNQLQLLGGAAFARFCLFLEPEEVKTRIAKVLDWARGKQERLLSRPKAEPKDEDASKALALLAALTTLTAEADGLAEELLMPLTSKDISSALQSCHALALRLVKEKAPKKKRRLSQPRAAKEVLSGHSWWWFDVATSCLKFLALAFKQGSTKHAREEVKIWGESLEDLQDVTVAIFDLFEFLPSDDLTGALSQALQSALVAMTSAAPGDAVKRLMQAILEKTRGEDAEVKLQALRCAHRMWTDLGVQVVTCLSEVIMYTSELQDDEDPRVESAVKALVRTIEDCTGESLQEAMQT
ncbi:unnamed protein product, partial [Durusdinium trenchii]